MNRLEIIPVPVLPTFVGAVTLGNVYSGMGYTWVRHLSMWAATLIVLLYVVNIVKFPQPCRKESETVVKMCIRDSLSGMCEGLKELVRERS